MPTFTVKKRVIAVGRDYAVHDEHGAAVFEIDGKLRFARTFDVKDPDGKILYSAKEKLLTIDQTFLIDAPGKPQMTVRRTTSSSVYPMKFEIVVGDAAQMHAHGSFVRDGVDITRESTRIASVQREAHTVVAEIFNVWTAEGEDAALMLALAMVIVEGDPSRGSDAMSSP
jgi:uncharacterized protein YxjI